MYMIQESIQCMKWRLPEKGGDGLINEDGSNIKYNSHMVPGATAGACPNKTESKSEVQYHLHMYQGPA
jgi:hypothetical protein